MQAAKKLSSNFRVARKNELYSIVHCDFHLPGTGSLTPRARRYLFFFIALVRSGYHSIAAPMVVISDAIYRAQGQTSSVRTLRSALAELESAGYLRRRKCRLGGDRSNAVIDLIVERFVFWTKVSVGNVVPCTTQSYISPCRQELPPDDRTIPNNRVNSRNYSVNKKINVEEQRAGARSNKSAKKHNYHPIVYTLMCVMANGQQKRKAIEMAKREIAGGENVSGVDWRYYENLWPALDCRPGGRREQTAKSEIVPLLIGHKIRKSSSPPMSSSTSLSETEEKNMSDAPPATTEQIAMLISICRSFEHHNAGGTAADPRDDEQVSREFEQKQSPSEQNQALSQEELSILSAAKQSVKNRR